MAPCGCTEPSSFQTEVALLHDHNLHTDLYRTSASLPEGTARRQGDKSAHIEILHLDEQTHGMAPTIRNIAVPWQLEQQPNLPKASRTSGAIYRCPSQPPWHDARSASPKIARRPGSYRWCNLRNLRAIFVKSGPFSRTRRATFGNLREIRGSSDARPGRRRSANTLSFRFHRIQPVRSRVGFPAQYGGSRRLNTWSRTTTRNSRFRSGSPGQNSPTGPPD
jgi:hypothetical protein